MTEDHIDNQENGYIIDAERAAELQRLKIQGDLITNAMGGLLPEISNTTKIHDVLDVACGPGDWAMSMARAYPQCTITGIDSSKRMIAFADTRKTINTHFQVMDVTLPLNFPDESFDLVNARLLAAALRKEDWAPLVQEYKRILRPGGIIRLTEAETAITNCPASERFNRLCMKALQLSGHSFSPDGTHLGITPMLRKFLGDAGFENIQRRAFVVDYATDIEGHQAFIENGRMALLLVRPFLLHMHLLEQSELDALYEQAFHEMEDPDYRVNWFFLTVWGQK